MNLNNVHELIKAENKVLKAQCELYKPNVKNNEKLQDEIKMRIIVLNGKVNEKKRKLK